MRKPTADPYNWWRKSLAGLSPPIYPNDPEPGYYWRRFVKGGPRIPCSISLVQLINFETVELLDDERLACEVNGQPKDPFEQWSYLASNPISKEDYQWLKATLPLSTRTQRRA